MRYVCHYKTEEGIIDCLLDCLEGTKLFPVGIFEMWWSYSLWCHMPAKGKWQWAFVVENCCLWHGSGCATGCSLLPSEQSAAHADHFHLPKELWTWKVLSFVNFEGMKWGTSSLDGSFAFCTLGQGVLKSLPIATRYFSITDKMVLLQFRSRRKDESGKGEESLLMFEYYFTSTRYIIWLRDAIWQLQQSNLVCLWSTASWLEDSLTQRFNIV